LNEFTEIISPSNQAHDLVKKLNLCMQYGVKEYWIVNPLLKTVFKRSLIKPKDNRSIEIL